MSAGQKGDADRDETRSCETIDNKSSKSQPEVGAAAAGAEASRFRQRKPVQYMPVTRSTRAPKVPRAQRSETAYLADVPPLLTEKERLADAANVAMHKEDVLIDPTLSEMDMKTYLRRGLAKLVISRCDPPPIHVVSFGESSSDSSDEDDAGEGGEWMDEGAGNAKRRRGDAGQGGSKRARITRSKAFLQEPPDPVCAENAGLVFVDGALVLFHPNIQGIFVDYLKER